MSILKPSFTRKNWSRFAELKSPNFVSELVATHSRSTPASNGTVGLPVAGSVVTSPGVDYGRAIKIQSDGKIVMAGFSSTGVQSRLYRFTTRQVQVNDDLTDVDFVGSE